MSDSRVDFEAALERGAVRPGSPAAQLASADAEAARALAAAVLARLPVGPAEGEDEAAWAALGIASEGASAEDSLDLPVEALTAQPIALDSIEIGLDDPLGGDDHLFVPTAPSTVPPPRGNGWMWGVAASMLLAVGGFAAWLGFADQGEGSGRFDAPQTVASAPPSATATTPVSAAPATVAVGAPASEAPATAAVEAPESDAPESVAAAGSPKRTTKTTRRRTKAPERGERAPEDTPPAAPATAAVAARAARSGKSDEVDDLLGNLDGGGGGRKARGGPATPQPASGGGNDPLVSEKLSKNQILQVVRQNAGKISGCKSLDPNASGTVKVTIVINRNGSVGSAAIAGGPLKGTPVGRCVEDKVRGFRFPQFSGDSMRINMPFRL